MAFGYKVMHHAGKPLLERKPVAKADDSSPVPGPGCLTVFSVAAPIITSSRSLAPGRLLSALSGRILGVDGEPAARSWLARLGGCLASLTASGALGRFRP